MSAELKPHLRLEIAHVLFIDIVGYSKLLIEHGIGSALPEIRPHARAEMIKAMLDAGSSIGSQRILCPLTWALSVGH
jgi:hypothetical protein